MDNGFSNKEVLLEIKDDLKGFREKYDQDQDRRDVQIAKRPTRGELWSLVIGVGAVVTAVAAFGG